jgi:hypothetical protein
VAWVVRVKDDIVAGIGICTVLQAALCIFTGSTSSFAVIRRRVPADRGNSRGGLGGGAAARGGGWAASAYGLVVDGQVGIRAIRTTFALIEGFTWVQPACAGACVGVAGNKDEKVAGRVGVTVVPAGVRTTGSNGSPFLGFLVAAEFGDERRCTGWFRGSRGSGCSRIFYRFS